MRNQPSLITCIVCKTKIDSPNTYNGEQGLCVVHCSNCGTFTISESAIGVLESLIGTSTKYLPLISHKIQQRQREDRRPYVDTFWIQSIFDGPLEFPSAFEQVENLVLHLAKVRGPGETMLLDKSSCLAAVGSQSASSLSWVLTQAVNRGWVQGVSKQNDAGESYLTNGALTLQGWEWYNKIGRHKQSRIAFMAMQYDDYQLNAIVNDYFRPAVKETGFELKLLADEPEAGLIDNRLRVEIRRSRFVIADLTHRNNGAYWEAGFGEGLGLPVIYTCERSVLSAATSKIIHFDTRNNLIVPWDDKFPDQAAKELKATIRNTLPGEAELGDPD